MKSDTPLDYALFQLSPKRSRCELLVSSNGNTEKLASGLVKPFVTHLKVAEEQSTQAVETIRLQVEQWQGAENWFTKGTLERFVRFVSTPEVLELVNTYDAEMSQLEAARRIYSMGAEDQVAGSSGELTAADATKKELLRAIDVRLTAVKQDLTAACARASAAGFNPDTVSDLQLFSDEFGANRLNEACTKFISLCERRPDLINPWKPSVEGQAVRASWGSDMSIDEPTEDPTGPRNSSRLLAQNRMQLSSGLDQQHRNQQAEHINQSNSSAIEKSSKEEGQGWTESPLSQPSQPPARRLSVQDRISLFESKQKEQVGSGSGGKPIVEKPVLRRLSSDVTSSAQTPTSSSGVAEKAVLRRWSGISDMSIDLGNDKKDSGMDSPLCTPTSSSISQAENNLSRALPEAKKDQDEQKGGVQNLGGELLGKEEEAGLKEKLNGNDKGPQKCSFTGSGEQFGICNQGAFQENSKGSLSGEEKSGGFKDLASFENTTKSFLTQGDLAGERNQAVFQNPMETFKSDNEFGSRGIGCGSRDQKNEAVAQSRLRGTPGHSRSQSGHFESSVSGTVPRETQYKGTEHEQWRSLAGEVEEVGKREVPSSGRKPIKAEDLEIQRMKKPVASGPEMVKKSQGRRDDDKLVFPAKKFSDGVESSAEQVQRVRQSKGNQELNDELKIKATELEKLFAEHKLRVPGDQSTSARRSKPTDIQNGQPLISQVKIPPAAEKPSTQFPEKSTSAELTGSSSKAAYFSTPPTMKMVDHHSYADTLGQSFSDDSKGKFYEKYMQKRDEKLKEEWSAKRAEKEARLKTMHDSLERSRAELKAKFSDREDSVSSARRRAEKVTSLNMWSNLKREQHPISSIQDEDEGDVSEFTELKYYGQDRSFNEDRSQTKKPFPNKNLSSSTTTRNTVASVSRPSAKISNSSSGRRRVQSENPLAQSVPNFSDLRKENTKPSSGTSKTTTRSSQLRNYPRSKSTNEDVTATKEERPRRSQHLRKSSAGPLEFATDMSPMNSDNAVLAPWKFDKEQSEEKFLKDAEVKPFLRKGNGIGGGSGIPKLKASIASEFVKEEEDEYDEMAFDAEDLGKDDEGEPENMDVEEYGTMDNNGKEESDKFGDSGSENGDTLRSLTHVTEELPASVPSPGESPISWNSRMRDPFAYPHEASDVDAYADSPIGSPASWNAQTEADARMRKKWGSAQKPFLVNNSSSRKDVTKGFKRLLKFGRKNRDTDNMVDWISATTSEGDDDTEDGRDPASRSSDDLRKSRMGFLHTHPSDDSFTETDMFNEHVQALNSSIPAPPANFKLREDQISGSSMKAPRSFFSLSTFRSKGSDSKTR
ncbi:hypothetical protein ACFE04_004021 [Oxalis oulophora]